MTDVPAAAVQIAARVTRELGLGMTPSIAEDVVAALHAAGWLHDPVEVERLRVGLDEARAILVTLCEVERQARMYNREPGPQRLSWLLDAVARVRPPADVPAPVPPSGTLYDRTEPDTNAARYRNLSGREQEQVAAAWHAAVPVEPQPAGGQDA